MSDSFVASSYIIYGCRIDIPEEDRFEEGYDSDDRGYPWTRKGIEKFLRDHEIYDFSVVKCIQATGEKLEKEYYLTFNLPSTTEGLITYFSLGRDFNEEFMNVLELLGVKGKEPSLFPIVSAK